MMFVSAPFSTKLYQWDFIGLRGTIFVGTSSIHEDMKITQACQIELWAIISITISSSKHKLSLIQSVVPEELCAIRKLWVKHIRQMQVKKGTKEPGAGFKAVHATGD